MSTNTLVSNGFYNWDLFNPLPSAWIGDAARSADYSLSNFRVNPSVTAELQICELLNHDALSHKAYFYFFFNGKGFKLRKC